MQGQYNAAVFSGKRPLVHMVYRDLAGKVTERVVMVRTVDAGGDGFTAYCLRRCAEGGKPGRYFLFERVLWARRWNGRAIVDAQGREIIPSRAAIESARRRRGVAA